MDPKNWPALRALFTQKFLEKTQRAWESVFDGTDCCVTPIAPLSSEDYQPIAKLSNTPGLQLNHLDGEILFPGKNNEEVIQEWIGWIVNREYTIDSEGTAMLIQRAKL
jgi:alpha-methylacyl-CoA racemase